SLVHDLFIEKAGGRTDAAALDSALRRNLYGTVEPGPADLAAMAGYVRAATGLLAGQTGGGFLAGQIQFPAIPGRR
ncbi:MAG: ubiquinol-cytochrome C chaperone family protein, partial [Dongiaceae bacterium]